MKYFAVTLLSFWLALPGMALGAELKIANQTGQAIINILVQPKNIQPFYLRLDLFPQGSDEVENPEVVADLRVDTGLQFWTYSQIDLKKLAAIIFCAEPAGCMEQVFLNGRHEHVAGVVQNLVPQTDSRPVCNLDRFRPAMPMKDVCAILPDHNVTDDNGAVLAGLGFANMVWAARLVPRQGGPINDNTLLEHLELRAPLSMANAEKALSHLFRQGFVPWQAEFPGQDLEFPENSRNETEKAMRILKDRLAKFLENNQAGRHRHDKSASCEQASIIMAPQDNLEALQNADEPQKDVLIYTIYARPCTSTLLLDVAAYSSAASQASPN